MCVSCFERQQILSGTAVGGKRELVAVGAYRGNKAGNKENVKLQ